MKVRVEKAGNRILLASDRPVRLKDAIPGAYFRKDKIWSLPLELTTCQLLREQFGARLQIGPLLWDWAKAEKAGRQKATTLAAAADAELRVLPGVAPTLAQAMKDRTYQRVAARFFADSGGRDGRRRFLLADTVGLGKTPEALGSVLEAEIPGPYLIICPKTAVNSTWKRQINRWLPEDEVIPFPESGKANRDKVLNSLVGRSNNRTTEQYGQGAESLRRTWVVVHPYAIRTQTWWVCNRLERDVAGTEAPCGAKTKYKAGVVQELDCGHEKDKTVRTEHEHVFPQLFDIGWGAVIVDESDQILIRISATPNLQRRGAEMLRDAVRPDGGLIAMSGTPFRSKPPQMWSTLNWLDKVRFSSKWRFIQTHWETESGFYGGTTIGKMRPDREEMLQGELSDIMLRRTRDEVRGDLPPKLYGGDPLYGAEGGPVGVWLPMQGAQLKAYEEMAKTGSATIKGGRISPVGVLAEMTRLRQFAGAEGELRGGEFFPRAAGNKWEWLVGLLLELGFPHDPATPIVIASQFTKLLKVFGQGLLADKGLNNKEYRLQLGYITGEETQAKRDANVEAFEGGGLNVMLLNTKAGGSSITLDAAEIMVVLDETWVDDEQEQLEGRIDNREPERRIVPRTYYYPRSLGSIEEGIAVANMEAKAAGRQLLDGGTAALARKVMEV